jgi:hypothetical protein
MSVDDKPWFGRHPLLADAAYVHAVAIANKVPQRGWKRVYENLADFSVWNAQRLDQVLDRLRPGETACTGATAPMAGQQLSQILVEGENRNLH